jgi:hypothetical protein
MPSRPTTHTQYLPSDAAAPAAMALLRHTRWPTKAVRDYVSLPFVKEGEGYEAVYERLRCHVANVAHITIVRV